MINLPEKFGAKAKAGVAALGITALMLISSFDSASANDNVHKATAPAATSQHHNAGCTTR